jgi:hypothetical protein
MRRAALVIVLASCLAAAHGADLTKEQAEAILAADRQQPSAFAFPVANPLEAVGGTAEDAARLEAAAAPLVPTMGREPALATVLHTSMDPRWQKLRDGFQGCVLLPDVRRLPPEAAAVLAGHCDMLVLSGLEELSPETAAALAPQGDLQLRLPPNTPPATLEPLTAGGRLTLLGVDDPSPQLLEVVAKAAGGLVLPDVVTLRPAAASVLAAKAGWVELPGLKEMPLDLATALGGGKAELMLTLDGIKEISPEAAAALRRRRGVMTRLRGLRTLTPAIAKSLVGMPNALELDGVESLDAETATALTRHNNPLHLSGLRQLEPDVVRSLARHRPFLVLGSREPLSVAAAEAACARKERMKLVIPGIDPAAARILAAAWRKLPEPLIEIEFSATPPDDVLEILAGCPGVFMDFDRFTRLSVATAKALVGRKNLGFSFARLAELPPEVATALTTDNPNWLAFGGLKTLSPELARILARHRGPLQFAGLETLDPEAAAALAEHGENGATLMVGIRRLTPEIARALSRYRFVLQLDLLETLDAVEAAALVGDAQMVSFGSLRSIDAATAQALAAQPGTISLGGLESLPPEVAEPLLLDRPAAGGGRQPTLDANLSLLTGLTPRLAEALLRRSTDAEHVGEEFEFAAIARLDSAAVADTLATIRTRIAFPGLRQASPEVLGRLKTNPLIELPDLQTLDMLPNADGSNDDFVVPE